MTNPKVCLVMIVRDEAAIIEERLRAILPEVDGWCITDTGSRDPTVDVVLELAREVEIPGTLHSCEWRGFAAARNEAIEEAEAFARAQGGEWWALLLDADTVFHGTRFRGKPNWRKVLDTGACEFVSCEVWHGSIRYSHPRLLKLGTHPWRWRGVLHEYLEIPPMARGKETAQIWVEHGSGGARSKDPEKFLKDAQLLRAAQREIEREPDHPDRDLLPRYTFYEAQSWRDAGEPVSAEVVYLGRTQMGGFFQEVYLAWLNVGELRVAAGELAGALEAFTRAWAVDPSRAEALIGLATICRTWEAWTPAFHFATMAQTAARTSGGMFADQNVRWRANFEISVAAWYVGQLNLGRDCCEAVLASPLAGEAEKERTRANLELYRAAIAAALR